MLLFQTYSTACQHLWHSQEQPGTPRNATTELQFSAPGFHLHPDPYTATAWQSGRWLPLQVISELHDSARFPASVYTELLLSGIGDIWGQTVHYGGGLCHISEVVQQQPWPLFTRHSSTHSNLDPRRPPPHTSCDNQKCLQHYRMSPGRRGGNGLRLITNHHISTYKRVKQYCKYLHINIVPFLCSVSHWGIIGKHCSGFVIVLKFLIRLKHSSLLNELTHNLGARLLGHFLAL